MSGIDYDGDIDAAFPDVVDRYGSMVVTLAINLTDAATGEDITQEVFLRAYRALRTYDAERRATLDMRPWLATITRNLVRNEYRRRQRKPTVALDDEDAAMPAAVDSALDGVESIDRLAAMLAPLPEMQRDAVILRHVVGLPIREVALALACPVGTAKSHVSRGLERMRQESFETARDTEED